MSMFLERPDTIDAVGIEKAGGRAVLSLIDALDWNDEENHLRLLENKLNTYLRFIESREIVKQYPDAAGRKYAISVYRFSSKERHGGSGMYYYGQRFCDPNLQRWLNRDPLGEIAGVNLYESFFNDPLSFVDPLGLEITYYYSQGGVLQPSGSTPYLGGENFGENLVASVYNVVPVAANALERFFEPVARVTDSFAEGVKNVVTRFTGSHEAGEGARNVLLVGSMFYTKRCPAKALTQAESSAANKINNILTKNFKQGPKGDISGALHDMVGNPIPKPGGGTYGHVQDLGNMLRGLRHNADALKNATDPAAIAARQQAQQAIQQMEAAIKGAGL